MWRLAGYRSCLPEARVAVCRAGAGASSSLRTLSSSSCWTRLRLTLSPSRFQFLKVDVDAVPDIARKFSVSAMPTFVILKGANKVDEMKGANPAGLMAMVSKHAPASGGAGASGSGAPVEKGLEGFVRFQMPTSRSKARIAYFASGRPRSTRKSTCRKSTA